MKTTQLQYNEWIFVPIVGFFVVGLGFMLSQMKTNQTKDVNEIKYQMPRPQDEFIGQYSLNGRKINRQYINPFAQKEKSQMAANNKVQGLKNIKKIAPKNKSIKKAAGLLNKKTFDVQVVNQTENALKQEINQVVSIPRMNQIEKQHLTNTNNKIQNSPHIKSITQWIELLTKNPTAENIVFLVKSYRNKTINASGFYQIINSLLSNEHPEVAQVGLYALQLQPESQAFQFASRKLSSIEDQSEIAQDLQQYLLSFNESQKIPSLVQVLQSKDQVAIVKAIDVLSQFNEASVQHSRFQQRGREIDQQQYSQLIASFKKLLTNENENIVSTAQNMLSKLQALVDSATIGS